MKQINFISSGMMGDFIHALSVVKNICDGEGAKANIYLTDNVSLYGLDRWRYGAAKAHEDLYDLVISREWVNEFKVFNGVFDGDFINLNNFRNGLVPPFKTWTKLLSSTFTYDIPEEYKWITLDVEKKDKIVIHSSLRRKNPSFKWSILEDVCLDYDAVFITSSLKEYENFSLFKNSDVKFKLVKTISEMALEIASAKYFIGNQSAPFALASALDVPRLVILDAEPAPFYMGEQEFSSNISWYLNDGVKYKADNCIVSI